MSEQKFNIQPKSGLVEVLWFAIGAGCSYILNHSVVWAIIHGVLAGPYLFYLCMGFGGGFGPIEDWASSRLEPKVFAPASHEAPQGAGGDAKSPEQAPEGTTAEGSTPAVPVPEGGTEK